MKYYYTSYNQNASELISKIFPYNEKILYLSFNYTEIVDESPRNSWIYVHGRFDGDIIFGIDSTGIEAGSDTFKFTKTRRKMSAQNKFRIESIPTLNKVETIRFFGHSLSTADYAYFKSLFDFYSIYSSDIELIFYFRVFNGISNTTLLNEQSDLVAQLLRSYGETLPNQSDGENLLHKLLLENRLKILEISTTRNKYY